MTAFCAIVYGHPVGQPRLRPSLRRSGRLTVHMPQTARPWRDSVAAAVRAAWTERDPIAGPIEVDLEFRIPRPRSHYDRKGEVKAGAPKYPTVKPDRDNLEKATTDALNGILWVDDSQIVGGAVTKRYVAAASLAGVVIAVRRLA